MSVPSSCFTKNDRSAISEEVTRQEIRTTGEIKVVILRHCWRGLRSKAARLFRESGLDQTKDRNAVMLLVVTANRECLVYGDVGIHRKLGQGYWDDIRDGMVSRFQEGKMTEGVCEAVVKIGKTLQELFPSDGTDENELSDEVMVADA